MTRKRSPVRFDLFPRPTQPVDILWPDGETEVIKGFITEYDALKWITEHEHSKGVAGKYE
jgi:hypothetical protein